MHRIRSGAHALVIAALAGCAATPPTPPPIPVVERAPASIAPQPDLLGVLAAAMSLQGKPYRYGGETPEQGFDCSGLVRYVYRQLGTELPRTAGEMATALPTVHPDQRRAGDLVFFNTSGERYSHVGVYIGDERFLHAPSTATGQVMVSGFLEPYWQRRFSGVRRPELAGR